MAPIKSSSSPLQFVVGADQRLPPLDGAVRRKLDPEGMYISSIISIKNGSSGPPGMYM